MNARYFAVVILLLMTRQCLAEVFKWTDAAGRVHYSDKAVGATSAERVEIKESVSNPPPTNAAGQSNHAPETIRQKVTIYTRPDCPYCKQAKADLRRRGVPYTERDIERSQYALKEYQAMRGRGVPITLVGSQRIDGYAKDSLSELLTIGGY